MDDPQVPRHDPRLTREQQALVTLVAPRVPGIVRRMRHLLGGVSFEDCESAGYEALVRGALRYDPALGVPFSAFVYPRVRGAMLDAARQASPDRRRLARAMKVMEAIDVATEAEAPPALASDPRTLAERVQAAAAIVRQAAMAVVLARTAEEADGDRIADADAVPLDELLVDAQTREGVQAAIARCEPDEQAMIAAIYFRGQSMHEHAAATGVHVSTVSRRHARALRKLAEWLKEAPP